MRVHRPSERQLAGRRWVRGQNVKRDDRVQAQRHAGVGAQRPPAPARRAARGARRHVAEGRLLAVGAVRVLHGARRRQGGRQLQPRAGQGRRQVRRHARGHRRRRAPALRRRVRRVRRPAVRLLHPRHRHAGEVADRQEGRRPRPRVDGAAPRRPPLPLHRLRQDPRRHRGGGQGQDVPAGARCGGRGVRRQVRGRASWPSATAATSTTSACPACSTPPCTSPPTPAPTSPPIDTSAAAAADGVVGVFTAADIPGELRVGIIHKDWPIMIPVGGRTSYAGDVLAIVVAETRQQARAAAELVDVGYDVLPPVTDPLAAIEPGADARRVGHRRQRAVAQRVRPWRRRRRPRRQRAHRPRGVPDPAHRARLPRAGVDAGRAVRRRRRAHGCTCTPAARACGTTATTSAACSTCRPIGSPSSWCPTAGRSAARRTWPTRPTPPSRRGCSTGR